VNNQWAILDGTPVQVLFTPEDKVMSKVIAVINDAQESVRFMAFSFTDDPLALMMINRAKAGVDVSGVFETFGSNSPNSELPKLWCAGLSVRQDGNSSFLHHKVIIVDDSIVITGSMNFSANADESNEENVIILDNAEIAALYLREFETVWGQAQSIPFGAFTCP
jgi:phosphatidylserine/phosphatidylglycerophosphate/cardiolipin synthase-like enzyme